MKFIDKSRCIQVGINIKKQWYDIVWHREKIRYLFKWNNFLPLVFLNMKDRVGEIINMPSGKSN